MIGEGFDIERPGGDEPAPQDPGRVAREAADRIAQQVREVLQSAEARAAEIRSQAERDAEAIRKDAAGAAARMLENVERLEDELEERLTGFFDSVRGEIAGLAPREEIEAAARHTQEFDASSLPEEPPPEPDHPPEPEPQAEPQPQEETARPFPEPGQEAEEPRRRRGLLWGRRERGDAEQPISEESEDPEDAHVMALNMALNGTPREETQGYLVQRFGPMRDLGAILDDVYGRVRGR